MNPEKYLALLHVVACVQTPPVHRLYDRRLTCISQYTQTPDKVFHTLLMSFHMQKKTLGLERNQILTQGRVLWGEGRGRGLGCKVIWRIVRTSEKILATPLIYCDNSAKR